MPMTRCVPRLSAVKSSMEPSFGPSNAVLQPREPEAPGWFSTTTETPRALLSAAAS